MWTLNGTRARMVLVGTVLAVAICARANVGHPLRIDVTPDSLADAIDRVRTLRESDKTNGVELVFAAGEYNLEGTLKLGARDGGLSASNPVVWRAAEPGSVMLTSAREVPVSRFRKVSDPSVLAKIPEEGRDFVYAADVGGLVRPEEVSSAEIFLDGDFADKARWPNGGEFTSFTGRVDIGHLNENRLYERGAFVYSNPRAKRWDFSKGVKLFGYWTHDWAYGSAEAHFYGTENGTNDVIRLSTAISYGVNGGTWGGRKERRFYVYDMLEELDAPREWWLDRENMILYLIPVGGVLKADARIVLAPDASALIEAEGLENFVFDGLGFNGHNGDVLAINGATDVTITNCAFTCVGRTALVLNGCRCRVVNCRMRHLGASGIHLDGGDRRSLAHSGNVVENCRILDFGVRFRTYNGAMEVKGCGHEIRNNEFAYAPHHAMRYETNDTVIEGNDIHHVLLETRDAGAIYTGRDCTTQGNVVRYNFIHELGAGGACCNTMGLYFDDCDCGDEVYGNIFWKCSRGIMLGGGRDHPIHGNVFAECTIGLSIDDRGITWKSFYQRKRGSESSYQPDRMARMHVTEEPWSIRYPHLARQLQDSPGAPLYNPVERNIFLDCKTLVMIGMHTNTVQYLSRMVFADNYVFSSTPDKMAVPDKHIKHGFTACSNVPPGFVNAAKGDFRLLPGSFAALKVPELKVVEQAKD